METEPELQTLNGESFNHKTANKDDEARSDLRVLGFWTRGRRAFFDVSAFSPYARSYRNSSIRTVLKNVEARKNREYKERILHVEHGDFTPLVFASSGGMAPGSRATTKRLGEQLAERKNLPYSVVMGWLSCRISFALLRSSLLCLRGSRGRRLKNEDPVIDLAVSEAKIERL